MKKVAKSVIGVIAGSLVLAACGTASTSGSASTRSAAPAAATAVDRVLFIGDSITGGWGFEGDNYPVLDAVTSLASCSQDPPPTDVCTNDQPGASNSNYDNGGVPAWIAYPYQFKTLLQGMANQPEVTDYAVSGATPAMWDPYTGPSAAGTFNGKQYQNLAAACNGSNPDDMATLDVSGPLYDSCDPNLFPGLYGSSLNPEYAKWDLSNLPTDGQTLSVFTLGANPILSRFLGLTFWGITAVEGADSHCARESKEQMQACVDRDIQVFRVVEHLKNLIGYLTDRGPVLVQKVYQACPGLFGSEVTGLSGVTSSYAACVSPTTMQNATLAVNAINSAIDKSVQAVLAAKPGAQVAAICPGNVTAGDGTCGGPGTFDQHQQTQTTLKYGGSFPANNPWIISTDTGIHPSAAGHRVLARGVASGACENFGLFCGALTSDQQWWPIQEKSCRSTYYCAFAAIRNNTDQPWKLSSMTQDSQNPIQSDAGEWILLPPQTIGPGETMRFALESQHSTLNVGAKGSAIFTDPAGNKLTVGVSVGLLSNSWTLKVNDQAPYSTDILANSKKKGSEIIMNGVVNPK